MEVTLEVKGMKLIDIKEDVPEFKNFDKNFNRWTEQVRKKTAKEFADIVYKALTDKQVWNAKHNWWLQNGECFELKDLLKQILKQQFGVEMEE